MTTTTPESVDFDGLLISFDTRVLRPRAWTVGQSRWAEERLRALPPGPVLELCCGAGQIGLAAVRRTDRSLICVDLDPVAVHYGAVNAREAGLEERVELRQGEMDHVLAADERFSLVIADPPWVPRGEVSSFPEDPPVAIDGGPDGLDVARGCLRVIERHLAEDGEALLQLGSDDQATTLLREHARLARLETRRFDRGVVVRLAHRSMPGV
jgi:release factor glutamine methyltransferase